MRQITQPKLFLSTHHLLLFFAMTGQSKAVDVLQQRKVAKNFVPPWIPFERPPRQELKKDQQLTVTLQLTPTNPTSQTYQMTIPFFRSGTPEQWLLVKKTLLKIIVGQNITQGPSKYSMADVSLKATS